MFSRRIPPFFSFSFFSLLSSSSSRAFSSSFVRNAAPRGADVFLAAALWGTTGTVRTLAPSSASPVSVGAARIVLGGSLLIVLAARGGDGAGLRRLLTGRSAPRRLRTRSLLAIGALCVAIYQTAFFAAVGRTGVATGTVVTIGSAPAFAGLLTRLTGGAPLPWRWFATTAGAVAGCAALILGGLALTGLAVLAGSLVFLVVPATEAAGRGRGRSRTGP